MSNNGKYLYKIYFLRPNGYHWIWVLKTHSEIPVACSPTPFSRRDMAERSFWNFMEKIKIGMGLIEIATPGVGRGRKYPRIIKEVQDD